MGWWLAEAKAVSGIVSNVWGICICSWSCSALAPAFAPALALILAAALAVALALAPEPPN